MKASEIKTDGTHYLVHRSTIPYKARVIEIRIPTGAEHRVVSDGRWYSSHQAQVKMAHVVFVRTDGTEYDDTWVALTNVASTWDEYQGAKAKQDERREAIDRKYSDLERRVEEVTGKRIYIARADHQGQPTGVAHVGADVIRALLDATVDATFGNGS